MTDIQQQVQEGIDRLVESGAERGLLRHIAIEPNHSSQVA